MQFSTKGRYALRLMIDLALYSNETAIPLKDVAARQEISVKYLEQIITPLSRAGLVSSVRGAGGGYKLGKSASHCTAGDVLRATEGSLAPIACLAPQAAPCSRESSCSTIDFWKGLQSVIEEYVDNITIEDLTKTNIESNDFCI